ncbi:MAG TPA: hypothetical protein PK079_19950 [Leptospiraceae bacterium]|nr:hypothetical protein [Leptospiraceae bacterium]HMW07700.1 hypothetical protein [Leptospiraceae bacterium]HMX34095.1 hypothetical protein [Leptospiraceae bacterium]HMY33286.1 hypothetical protein [Leptospiraceae bacterium]HMZ63023.1 hypothetical protein [Leptospiraceae bacterium]
MSFVLFHDPLLSSHLVFKDSKVRPFKLFHQSHSVRMGIHVLYRSVIGGDPLKEVGKDI